MDEHKQKICDTFLNNCTSVIIFGYAIGAFIVSVGHADNFQAEFTRWNEKQGLNYQITKLPNYQFALTEW